MSIATSPASTEIVALYPGSFDPIHNGHVDVIEQAVHLFGNVIVVAMYNPGKTSGEFSIDQRIALMSECTAHIVGVTVQSFAGLAVDAAKHFAASFLVKGLRNAGDFEIEQQMAQTNYAVAGVRTVYLPCRPDQVFVSSRFVREISHYGGDVSSLVPSPVVRALGQLRTPPTFNSNISTSASISGKATS